MTLLLIVVGVGFPSLRNFFHGRTLDSEARRFLTLTRYAQSRAVSEGVPMVLWVDVRERTYGLQAQAGYLDTDGKAVEYELEEDLQMEVSAPLVRTTTTTAMSNQRTRTTSGLGHLPAIRFTPDGFVGETSPETVQFRESAERDSSAIWITQAPNRLTYEISANPPATFRR